MGVNQMTGTPWHVETLRMNEDDERRHKSRCTYYYKANKYCKRLNQKCPGSAHCDYYQEDPARIREIPSSQPDYKNPIVAQRPANTPKTPAIKIDYDGNMLYPTGCHVIHKTHGAGIVTNVDKEFVTVEFEQVGSKELSVAYCTKNSLLVRENTEEEIELMKQEALKQQELENKKKAPVVSETDKPETIQSAEVDRTTNINSESTEKIVSKPKTKTIILWIVATIAFLLFVALLLFLFSK